jgi:hypothetical protein
MYLGCKKKFFVCEIQKPDGSWTRRLRIATKGEWEKVFNNDIAKPSEISSSQERLKGLETIGT